MFDREKLGKLVHEILDECTDLQSGSRVCWNELDEQIARRIGEGIAMVALTTLQPHHTIDTLAALASGSTDLAALLTPADPTGARDPGEPGFQSIALLFYQLERAANTYIKDGSLFAKERTRQLAGDMRIQLEAIEQLLAPAGSVGSTGERQCAHCAAWYPESQMHQSAFSDNWYHNDHPVIGHGRSFPV